MNGLVRREIQNQRDAARRAELDEENLGDLRRATSDTAYHALAQTGIEAAAQEHEVGNTRRLHRNHLGRAGRGRSARRKRRGGDEREQAGLEETTEHRKRGDEDG